MTSLDKMSLEDIYLQGSTGTGFVNRDRDWEISPFAPTNELGTENSLSQVSLSELGLGMDFNQSRSFDQDWTILSHRTQ